VPEGSELDIPAIVDRVMVAVCNDRDFAHRSLLMQGKYSAETALACPFAEVMMF
jgi:hypothetical protein